MYCKLPCYPISVSNFTDYGQITLLFMKTGNHQNQFMVRQHVVPFGDNPLSVWLENDVFYDRQ